MPAAASVTTSPSRTSANANTNTQDTAKKSVVATSSRLLTSIATSLRSTSSATRLNTSGLPHEIAIARAQPGAGGLVAHQPPAADYGDARHDAVGQIQIVRRDDDDSSIGGELAQA